MTTPEARPVSKQPSSKKRKQPSDAEPAPKDPAPAQQDPSTTAGTKKAKKRKKGGATLPDGTAAPAWDDLIDTSLGVNRAIRAMEPGVLVAHLAQKTRRFNPELSELELEGRLVPVSAVRDTRDSEVGFEGERVKEGLVGWLEKVVGKEGKKGLRRAEGKGRPHTLVVAGSGLRAAELVRALRPLEQKPAQVAKLFAKHLKLSETIAYLSKHPVSIGVGTPQRLSDLLEDGALSAEALERIVIDASFVDVKKRGIMDMRETVGPLGVLLSKEGLKERYAGEGGGKLEILFF